MLHDKKEMSFGNGINLKYLKNLKKFKKFDEIFHFYDLNLLLSHYVARMEKPLIAIGHHKVLNQHLGLLITSNYGSTTEKCSAKAD